MDREEYIAIVSETNADIEQLIHLTLRDYDFLKMVVSMLMNDKRINVYYHSYHILVNSLAKKANILLPFWDEILPLLGHENSYHRNYGMDLISSTTEFSEDIKFEAMLSQFYVMLQDEKISTRKYCITYSIKNIEAKPHYADKIVSKILTALETPYANKKHKVLLCKEFVRLLEQTSYHLDDRITLFLNEIMDELDSKTLNKAIEQLFKKG